MVLVEHGTAHTKLSAIILIHKMSVTHGETRGLEVKTLSSC